MAKNIPNDVIITSIRASDACLGIALMVSNKRRRDGIIWSSKARIALGAVVENPSIVIRRTGTTGCDGLRIGAPPVGAGTEVESMSCDRGSAVGRQTWWGMDV